MADGNSLGSYWEGGGSNTTSPWYYWDPAVGGERDNGTIVLGRFSGENGASDNEGLASVVWKDHGSFRTIWGCSGGWDVSAYRAMAEAAGVHFFLGPDDLGDVVEAQSSVIMIHAGPSTASPLDPGRVRHVSLPTAASQVKLIATTHSGGIVCSGACSAFDTDALQPGDTRLYEVSWAAKRATAAD